MSPKVLGTKQPCRAHASATIPVMSQDFVAKSARSMALNLFSHGAFYKGYNEISITGW